jgi:hypothetical protein
MSRRLGLLAAVLTGTALLANAAVAELVNVALYDSYVDTPGVGISFSNYAGPLTANDIMFYSDNSGQWFPTQIGGFGASFGANMTAGLSVAATGTYDFTVGSDDADYVFIDGTLVGSEPGDHGYFTTPFSVFLTAGTHALDVELYNGPCCGSGVVAVGHIWRSSGDQPLDHADPLRLADIVEAAPARMGLRATPAFPSANWG